MLRKPNAIPKCLSGFLSASVERDPSQTGKFSTRRLPNPVRGPWFPVLQTSVQSNERGSERLQEAIEVGWVGRLDLPASVAWGAPPIHSFGTLRSLILDFASLPNGYETAADILSMRIHSARDSGPTIDEELVQCGRELVRRCPLESSSNAGLRIGRNRQACFLGHSAVEAATAVCHQLKAAFMDYKAHPYHFRHLLGLYSKRSRWLFLMSFWAHRRRPESGPTCRFQTMRIDGGSPLETAIAGLKLIP